MKKYKIGYTQGVYDMFHIGHLNLLNNAKKYCDYLIVGVNSDALVEQYKHKTPVINQEERRIIVENIKAVDSCEVVDTLDKVENYKRLHFDAIFIGDDWKGNARWAKTEEDLKPYGVDVVYLPHTQGVCSTDLRKVEDKHVGE
ncbi:MAG: adenylyltransferase/cytidyltransferase family protein [Lachnospiraceae bacterium]|nr:adenylyltransferase/cytidyltransferase family protein [Lachnospiraceae bacterium]